MQIKSIKISNVLSFAHYQNIEDAQEIKFDKGLNIIIGENGAGKSTVLEVINFVFRRVLFKQYMVDLNLFRRRNEINANDRKQTIQLNQNNSYRGFRLDPNWDTEDLPQKIRLVISLDDIDKENIHRIDAHKDAIFNVVDKWSNKNRFESCDYSDEYIIDVGLFGETGLFDVSVASGNGDFGFEYLAEYNFYKQAIDFHNIINSENALPNMFEPFMLIGGYRNYHAFSPSVTLNNGLPAQQIQNVKVNEFTRSLNASEGGEPSIFALVRLKVAELYYDLADEAITPQEREERANNAEFMRSINHRLRVVNLVCRIKLIDKLTWAYSFEFFDTRRNKAIPDVNCLSAGQKSILHLVFEAYGRGDLKGGVVIIDEPEIHLHYQFQHEYLKVIRDLNRVQDCQYILVTHSEALINANTIRNVRRFTLADNGQTNIYSPSVMTAEKDLIKILDNTRSTYAFFAKKVVLVEGESDQYLLKSYLNFYRPDLDQEIAVLSVGGKKSHKAWKNLFQSFGLKVAIIADFDYLIDRCYPNEASVPLRDAAAIQAFKAAHVDWETNIDDQRDDNVFILKHGDLEAYLHVQKSVTAVITYCQTEIAAFAVAASHEATDYRTVVDRIIA